MKILTPRFTFAGAILLAALLASLFMPDWNQSSRFTHLGDARQVGKLYQQWEVRHELNGGDSNVIVGLGWSKGLSCEFTTASGVARLDLVGGEVTVEARGLSDREKFDVWLVEDQPGPAGTIMPEPEDRMVNLGTLMAEGEKANLNAAVKPGLLADFELDLVVVARTGQEPAEGLLFGLPTTFQRLYSRERRARLSSKQQQPPKLAFLSALTPTVAYAESALSSTNALVAAGHDLFFDETFGGNGRTCGSCHPAENNFTVDPQFIAGLPDDDPLFVAEFVPALASNFEKPALMRELGLILENTNGFNNPQSNFTMRGVPHTLALSVSLAPAAPSDFTVVPPNQRTGWSGDGAPGSGTLFEFGIGAVTQHFTKTMGRVPGVDFDMPTGPQLMAMEAFQLALGRQADLNLAALNLKGAVARRGLELFNDPTKGKCFLCHENAGANLVGTGQNFNFDTGVVNLLDHPAKLITAQVSDPNLADFPHDDGFGNSGTDGSFNTPPLVEAADTGPFFHDNAIRTLEEAVGFYNSNAFNNSFAGQFLVGFTGSGIELEATEVEAIAAFLRVINVLENIRSARELLTCALDRSGETRTRLLKIAKAEVYDAREVLENGGLHPDAEEKLEAAYAQIQAATKTGQTSKINRALLFLSRAEGYVVD